ncbi:hypothetical protein Ddye_016320 [Dipteronia dyeriana]|uniref:Uncharacterized protein n=1 Tax=Dipteronia dyeriana TaxID=168575 RepID=A0AAD9U766_9ROSI|nr:hypothetical protein Ddye_016320 [Dipteronia dyeriana]
MTPKTASWRDTDKDGSTAGGFERETSGRSGRKNTKKRASSITDFVLKVKTIRDKLKAVGQVVSDNDLILSVLNGFGHEYDSIAMVITSQRCSMSLQEARYLFLNHEQRIAQLSSTTQLDIPTASANFIATHDQNDKRV